MIRRLAVASLLLAATGAAAFAQPHNPDINNDGFISRAENLAAMDRGFARMDADKDGAIGPAEQAKIAKMMGGRNILAPADLDKDGKVSKAELVKASNYRFDQADANRDGRLDKAEQATLRANRGG
ncbi:MAG: EF-hand domain-containing protein [Caulobacter sp.]|nr:EF-hand domain-containing protein [Caulobacter sp.]